MGLSSVISIAATFAGTSSNLETAGKTCLIAAGIVGGVDSNKTGADDVGATILATTGDVLLSLAKSDGDNAAKIIDAGIVGLQKLKSGLCANEVVKDPTP